MRTFIAIELQPELRTYLSEVQTKTKQYCRRGNYTPEENLHITLHFLGDIQSSDVEYIRDALFETGQKIRAFDLKLDKLGVFSRGEQGVLWAGLQKNPILEKMFYTLEKSLQRQGFPRDKKGLNPHITLGREVVPQRNFTDLTKAVHLDGRSFRVEKISLMESVRFGQRLVYKPIYVQLLKDNFKED